MQTKDVVTTTAKIFLFGLTALSVLLAGGLAANYLWWIHYGRYATPNTGYYHGYVTADIYDRENYYWLRIEGNSEPQWYWMKPANFTYSHLALKMHAGEGEMLATVELPSLLFRSGKVEEKLSPELLSTFLLKDIQAPTNGIAQMKAIVDFISNAGEGKLPVPRHHRHRIEGSVNVGMYHWLLGWGIRGTIYVWLVIWIALVVYARKRVFKKPAAAPKI